MSTINTMNMSSTNTSTSTTSMKATDGLKSTFSLPKPSAARIAAANPMRMFEAPLPQIELIDEALDIINSPGSTSTRRTVSGRRGSYLATRASLQRRGSSLSERSSCELLMDNSDRLSQLLQSGIQIDFDSDDESDLDV